ncbi:hypothetical protein [Marinobacter caseinilyticus]|uniref:hypothetical protein n=1 Tax=Marinobacter caseinilyticus TaxID=2692195 RepID=UPI00140A2A81|nr:hypothetical protein [Marinobacter caseinilyticus]
MADTTPLFIALIFGSIGIGYLVYGRRQQKKPWFYTGLALMVFPYLVTTPLAMLVVGVTLLLLPRFIP